MSVHVMLLYINEHVRYIILRRKSMIDNDIVWQSVYFAFRKALKYISISLLIIFSKIEILECILTYFVLFYSLWGYIIFVVMYKHIKNIFFTNLEDLKRFNKYFIYFLRLLRNKYSHCYSVAAFYIDFWNVNIFDST